MMNDTFLSIGKISEIIQDSQMLCAVSCDHYKVTLWSIDPGCTGSHKLFPLAVAMLTSAHTQKHLIPMLCRNPLRYPGKQNLQLQNNESG